MKTTFQYRDCLSVGVKTLVGKISIFFVLNGIYKCCLQLQGLTINDVFLFCFDQLSLIRVVSVTVGLEESIEAW